MKKTIGFLAVTACLLFTATTNATPVTTTMSHDVHVYGGEWKKSATASFPGIHDGKTYWYKIDSKAKLWWSKDGKEWAAVKDGMWADKEGKWLKIHSGKLVWSADMGKTWDEVPEWKWEASDGKWYKYDSKWALWVNE